MQRRAFLTAGPVGALLAVFAPRLFPPKSTLPTVWTRGYTLAVEEAGRLTARTVELSAAKLALVRK